MRKPFAQICFARAFCTELCALFLHEFVPFFFARIFAAICLHGFVFARIFCTDLFCTDFLGPATTQNLVVKFDGEICGGVLVENASDDFPQQKKLENLLPNFAGSSPPISPTTSPTSLWKSLVLRIFCAAFCAEFLHRRRPDYSSNLCPPKIWSIWLF